MEPDAIDKYDLLPTIPGPKLPRFQIDRSKKIEYLELLGSTRDEAGKPCGAHGYVFKVLINSRPFALKIFRFFDPETSRSQMGPLQNSRISDDDIVGQGDPFYAECRAYGRIDERQRKRPIAVVCHGFISVPAVDEPVLEERFQVTKWDRPKDELSKPFSKRRPFRALVKDLVESDPEITNRLLKVMLRDLKSLHSLRIYVMDIAIRNYKGGKVVDFSNSWTEPHYMFRKDVRSKDDIRQLKGDDLNEFREMVEDLGFQTSSLALRNYEVLGKLRSRSQTA